METAVDIRELTKGFFRENPLFVIVLGVCPSLGFTLVMLLMSAIRERIELLDLPKPMRGMPIAFVCTGLMALAFLGFTGMA